LAWQLIYVTAGVSILGIQKTPSFWFSVASALAGRF
jgi:hypothetical protein